MSFPRANLKRFNDISGCAPPVGSYDPKEFDKKKSNAFNKSDRFLNSKDEGPAPNSFDVSVCSGYGTPTKKKSFNVTMFDGSSSMIKQSEYYDSLRAEILSLKQLLLKKDREIKRLQSELDDTVVTLLTDLQIFQAITLSLEEKIDELETSQDGTDQKTRSSVLTDEISKVISDGNKASTSDKLKIAKENAKKLQKHFQQVIAESEKKINDIKVSMEGKVTMALERQKDLECELQHIQENLGSAISCSQTLQKYRDTMEKQNETLREQVRHLDTEQLDLQEKVRYLKGEVFAISDEKLQEAQSVFEANAEIAELKEQLEQLEEELKTLNSNIKAMTEKYQDLDTTLAAVRRDSKRDMEELSAQLQVAKSSLKDEKTECEALQKCNKELMETITQKQNEIEVLTLQFETDKKETVQLKEQAAVADDAITVLEIQLEASRIELRNTQEVADDHVEKIAELQEKITVMKIQEEKLFTELEQETCVNQQTARGHADRIIALEQKEISIQDQSAELTKELEDLKLAKTSVEKRIDELKREIQDLNDKKEVEISTLTAIKNKEIEQVMHDLYEIGIEKEDMKHLLVLKQDEHCENVLKLEKSIMDAEKEMVFLRTELTNKEALYSQRLIENNAVVLALQSQEEHAEQEKQELLSRVADLTGTKLKLESDLVNFETQINDITEHMEKMKLETDKQSSVLTLQLESMSKEKAANTQLINELESAKSLCGNEVFALQNKLQVAEIEIKQNKLDCANAVKNNEDILKCITEKFENTEQTNVELGKINVKLEADGLDCNDKLEKHRKEINELQIRMNEMKLKSEGQIHDLTAQLEQLLQEKTEVSKSVFRLEGCKHEYEIQLSNYRSKLQLAEIETNQQEFTFTSTIKETEDELEVIKAKLEKSEQEKQKEKEIRTELQNDLCHYKEEFKQHEEECRNKITEKENIICKYEKETGEHQEKNMELQQLVNDLKYAVSEQEGKVTNTNSKMLLLQMEIDEYSELRVSFQKTTLLLEQALTEKDALAETVDNQQSLLAGNDEKMERMKAHVERLQCEHEDVISNLESLQAAEVSHLQQLIPNQEQEDRLQQLNKLVEKWQGMYEALQTKVEPFMKQLDAFEVEKLALLGRSKDAQKEMEKLSQRYAQLLGHQNQKQKIHHIVKIKDENNALKREMSSLRENDLKQKRIIHRLEEKLAGFDGKKRFDPTKAFKCAKEEKQPIQSPLKDGNRK